jgi:RNA polymerase sigma-70 factor (ECF subfamily)
MSEVVRNLLAANRGPFLRFVRSRVGSEALAEDILSGAYVRAVERAAEVQSAASATAWFYRILSTAVADHFRAASRDRRGVAALGREVGEDAVVPARERVPKVCGCVSEVLPELKPEYVAAIEAVDLAGTPVERHAAAVGITSNNASVRLHRARAALRKRVVTVCGACAAEGCLDCSCS